jgi:hypothetical protein
VLDRRADRQQMYLVRAILVLALVGLVGLTVSTCL